MPEETESSKHFWQRVEEVFHQALDLPPAERSQFVQESSSGNARLDREVREEVRDMLRGYEEQERIGALAGDRISPGSRYGAFEIVRKLGEGGMGSVYLARRHEDFEQQAAIKLINGSPAAVALMADRFRQERQILAALEHPNIARLLDGGIASGGQQFLVMEYVEGVRLDQYCAGRDLLIRRRIELFCKICAAVHFAHQHLVVHRDLKPGNILVNEQGEPKLLDFGIAKVLSAPDSPADETATMTGRLMLTPQYASPEQFQGLPCTVASDVYSLGVILYELLAGRGPYSATASTPGELIAAVMIKEAPLLSATAPESVRPALRGDLDGIVMKALAKKPAERYGSVEQLAEDLRRHLEGLPVSAVEGTRLYLVRKFVGRHRPAVGAAALLLLSLIAGLAGTLWQARAAERERVLAEQRFSDARKLANYLLFGLYDAVRDLPGSLPVRAEMASQSLLYLDRLAAAKSSDPALHLELAEGYLRLGTILESPYGSGGSLGNPAKALDAGRKALALLEPLDKSNGGDTRVQQDLARAYLNLGPALSSSGKPDEAVARLKQATQVFDRLAESNPKDVTRQIDAGLAWLALTSVLGERGVGIVEPADKDRMLAAAERAITHLDAALRLSPKEVGALRGLAAAYVVVGDARMASGAGDLQQAAVSFKEGLTCLERLPPAEAESPDTQRLAARLETELGRCYGELKQFGEALGVFKPAQEALDRLSAADPKNATIAFNRLNVYRGRAFVELNAGHPTDAIADYRMAIGILDGLIAVDPSKLSNRVVRAEAEGGLAKLLADSGHLAEAQRYGRAGLKDLDEIADRPDAAPQSLNVAAYANMEPPVSGLTDYPRAIRYAQRADQLTHGKDPVAVFYLAQAYEDALDGPKAMEALQRFGKLIPPARAGQAPSRVRLIYEKHLRQIHFLIQTGHLP